MLMPFSSPLFTHVAALELLTSPNNQNMSGTCQVIRESAPNKNRDGRQKLMLKLVLFIKSVLAGSMLGGSLVTTAWHVLRLQMEGSLPVMEGSCEYIK
jgi:hypothetical protein